MTIKTTTLFLFLANAAEDAASTCVFFPGHISGDTTYASHMSHLVDAGYVTVAAAEANSKASWVTITKDGCTFAATFGLEVA